ncbi:MAG: major facilitator superfamily 1 [Pseudonocardiales bacterium]|nr:major facilitator superfamily 1 [Pseudonocardiales bacterium]
MTSDSSGVATGLLVVDTRWSKSVWALLVVLCGALFLDGLDVSMVGVALPSIGRGLHLSARALQWIVSGYVLGYGGMLLLGGRTSDLLGRRSVFLVAVSVFASASVVSAFMTNDLALVALRFIKGAGAAFTVPAGLSILTTTFEEGPARNKAFSIWTACGATGFSSGLVFGGLLTELGWRATFLVPGPIGLALVAAGAKVIPRAARLPARLHHFDLPGALISTAGLMLLVFTLVEAPADGWARPHILVLLAASIALLLAFVAIEARHPTPLVRLSILRSPRLAHANVCGAVMAGSYFAFQFITTLYLQDSLGWSPIEMAAAFLPTGVLVGISSIWLEQILDRIDSMVLIMAGLTFFVAAYAWFLHAKIGDPYLAFMLPSMLLLGLGFACTFPAVTAQATSGVDDSEQGLASGLVNTCMQIGGALVLAVVSGIVGGGRGTPARGTPLPQLSTAIVVVLAVAAAGAVATAVHLLRAVAAARSVTDLG